ncbi:MAG: hypothetical protein ACREV1_13545 [Gammaproteobacteria bacterium]
MNRSMKFGVALVAGIGLSGLANAAEHTGAVFGAHLNPAVANRGVCTILSPVTVGGSPWFCNYKPNALYAQINSLVEQAAVNGLDCKISSGALGFDGHHAIGWISCPAF